MTGDTRVGELISRLEADLGMSDLGVPADPARRWDTLRGLMNLRPPGRLDPDVLELQDGILRDSLGARGVIDASSLEFDGEGFCIWQGDITALKCDAIVNAANSGMLGCFMPCHRCIDNAIHTYAGMQLRLECQSIMRGRQAESGRAIVTGAYNLPCSYIIHTVGPIVRGRLTEKDRQTLASCYLSCMDAASSLGLGTIAFCCISTGEYMFPNKEAAEIAVTTVRECREKGNDIKVIFDVFKDCDLRIYNDILR